MKLLIVESPNKCKTIKSYLGSDFVVEASVGHVRTLPESKLSVDEKTFEPTYAPEKKKAAVIKKLRELAAKAEKVYLATDPDREGEAISWHVLQLLNLKDRKKCVRIAFHEITKKAVQEAIKNPREIDQNLVEAQKARQVLDRLLGYKVSPLVWRCVQRGTSAGRVQSVALRMIVERQKEIEAFKPDDYWFIDANLQCANGPFQARVQTKEKDNRYVDHKQVDKDLPELKKATYSIADVEKKQKSVAPYPPFDTASLQTACSSLFGWSAPKTQKLAQEIYEAGLSTYIRTDSFNMAKEAVDEAREYIQKNHGTYLPDKPRAYSKKSSAASQEAHECIRPTHLNAETGLSGDAADLYKLIWARFVACQMSNMVIDTVTYWIDASSGHKLAAHGQTVKELGWYAIYADYAQVKDAILPEVAAGEKLKLLDIKDTKHTTQPPPKYNDGSLVKRMEEEGIGRPSTRAAIIKALQDKGYVDKDGKAFTPTELGKKVSDFLLGQFLDNFMDIKYTAGLEEDLDLIADGKKGYLDVVKPTYETLMSKVSTVRATVPKKEPAKMGAVCPVCKKGDVIERESRFGKFYCCSAYPKCKAILVKGDDDKFTKKASGSSSEMTKEKCPECGAFLAIRTNRAKGTKFYGCTKYPRCKYTRDVE